MLEVFGADITDCTEESLRELWEKCSPESRKRIWNLHGKEAQMRSLCAVSMLQDVLAEYGRKPEELVLYHTANGKPYVKDLPGFFFNISHSGKWAVLACSDSEVGVDVERIRRSSHRIASRFFSEPEKNYLDSISDWKSKEEQFTKLWTAKESYVKYTGNGLRTELSSFSVVGKEADRLSVYFTTFRPDEDYFLTVCSEKPEKAEFTVLNVPVSSIRYR